MCYYLFVWLIILYDNTLYDTIIYYIILSTDLSSVVHAMFYVMYNICSSKEKGRYPRQLGDSRLVRIAGKYSSSF